MGNLVGVSLNLQIALDSMAILTILILSTQEHGLYFHVFESCSFFFLLTSYSSQHRSLSLPWLDLFRCIFLYYLKRDFFFFPFFLLMLYQWGKKNATDFCVLILYPTTLQNLSVLIASVWSLQFSIYSIMSYTYDNFTYSLPMWILFSFSRLTAVTRTSNTVLNTRSKTGHSCLFQISAGRISAFHC